MILNGVTIYICPHVNRIDGMECLYNCVCAERGGEGAALAAREYVKW